MAIVYSRWADSLLDYSAPTSSTHSQHIGTHVEQCFAFAAAVNAGGLVSCTRFCANGSGVEDLLVGGDLDYEDMIVLFSLSS